MKRIWKRGLALVCVLALCLGIFPVTALAADLPDGWWPRWSAYETAVASGDKNEILRTGSEVEQFYANYTMTLEMANQLYMIYFTRLENLYFENEGNYAAAIENTRKLKEVSQFQESCGADRAYTITRCDAHLALLAPTTGVYAVSNAQSNTYGSSVAAASGTYYGSIYQGQFAKNGEAGVVSFYVELGQETAKQFDYLIRDFSGGKNVVQINLNFPEEGDTAYDVSRGYYDSNIRETLTYLATLKCPVLLRIGGEMDVWENHPVTAADYIAAYNYIGKMARSLAPKVELVWSPNSACGWDVNAADYYPDNNYVDWVGMSLYYNYDNPTDTGELHWQEQIQCGRFTDPVSQAESVISIAREHNKPVAITEGGAAKNGSQGEAYAAKQVAKALSTLTMVYPDIKSIVFFDREINGNDYTLTGNVGTAARNAVAANPTLLGSGQKQAGTYVPLEDFSEKTDKLILGATGRTYNNMDLSVEYRLDQKWLANGSGSPNQCELNLGNLTPGTHKLEAIFRDGYGYTETKTYVLLYAEGKLSCYTPEELYTDCDFNGYYYPAVLWVRENNNAVGASGSSFYPTKPCTRAEAVTFIWGAYGRPEPKTTVNPFTDTPADWYRKPILWAVEQGITNGTSDTTFSPEKKCERDEIVTFLYRAKTK